MKPFWIQKDPRLTPRQSAYYRNCDTCYYQGAAKVDDMQLTKCMICLNDYSRPGWVDRVHMIRILGQRSRAKNNKILGAKKGD